MKVCFISLRAYPLFNPCVNVMHGGAEVQISILARMLSTRNEFDTHVITANYGQKPIEKKDGITIWRSFNFNLFTPVKIYLFLKIFRKVNADIYIQRTLSFYSFFLALYCKFKKKKFIYMVAHDFELTGKEKLYRYPFGSKLAAMLFKHSSAIIVQNNYQLKLLMQKFNPSMSFTLKKTASWNEIPPLFKNNTQYDVIWLARAETWKQPQLFLDLAHMNPSLTFLMICPHLSQSVNNREYKALKDKADAISNLTFVPYLPYESIPATLNSGKVFCCTSSGEGDLPMSVIEAASAGLPILLLSLCNYNSDHTDGIGFYCNNSMDTLNKQLNLLIDNNEEWLAYSHKSLDFLKKYHYKELVEHKFIDILNQVHQKNKP